MADRSSKEQRKALLRQVKQQQRAEAEAQMPVPISVLHELFEALDTKLEVTGCDHTLVHTREFLAERTLDETRVLPWLAQYGGYCDCEVLANVENEWGA
jgi:hypothetical protein